ncbi:MAG: hypothetical protein FWF15_07710, partial [Oscillospiraceae bacterium]|nr:hypothetical protein [Oscillospiraceae bacterium]
MKKIISIILLFIFVSTFVLYSCTEKNSETEQDSYADPISADTTAEIPVVPKQDFGGYEFRVLRPAAYMGGLREGIDEVFAEAENGDPINDAIYKRNMLTEDWLNVKIKSINSGGIDWNLDAYAQKIIQAGSDEFDAVIGMMPITLIESRCLVNLYSIDSIDLSSQRWDQDMVKEMSYKKSKIYHITGDIVYYDKYSMTCMIFNKKLFIDYGFDFPYDKVKNGTWVYDEFSKLAKDFTRDVNGDGMLNQEDQWGLIDNVGVVARFVGGFGNKMGGAITVDNAGVPVYQPINEWVVNAVTRVCEHTTDKTKTLLFDTNQVTNYKGDVYEMASDMFANNQVLFYPTMLGTVEDFRNMESDFGIIPVPKYDVIQDRYYAPVSIAWETNYSIPTTNKDVERTGSIIEAMSVFSGNTLRRAIIDVSLKVKFVRDEESAEMLEILFDSKSHSFGLYSRGGSLYGLYCTVATKG